MYVCIRVTRGCRLHTTPHHETLVLSCRSMLLFCCAPWFRWPIQWVICLALFCCSVALPTCSSWTVHEHVFFIPLLVQLTFYTFTVVQISYYTRYYHIIVCFYKVSASKNMATTQHLEPVVLTNNAPPRRDTVGGLLHLFSLCGVMWGSCTKRRRTAAQQ